MNSSTTPLRRNIGNRHHNLAAICIIALSASIVGAEDGTTRHAFLQTFCAKCHNAEQHRGDVRLDQFASHVTDDNHKLWEQFIHNIQRGDMPPEDARQPTDAERRAFLAEAIPNLEAYVADSNATSDPLMRLTNNQIAHSLQDLLQTHEHIADQLIGDPVDKHGFSRQGELDLSGSYLQLYAKGLEQIVERAMPDLEPVRPNVFRIAGNEWEKCHWAGDNYLYQGYRRLYEGPKWIGDDFEIPIPPRHEYRMFLRDNRSKGRFRIKLTLRNEPPTYGYGEHFLLKRGTEKVEPVSNQIVFKDLSEPRTVQIPKAGIYQVDVTLKAPTKISVTADSSMLQQGLVGAWSLNGDAKSASEAKELTGQIAGGAQFVDSPFGTGGKAISLDGHDDAVVIPRNRSMDVGKEDFTVAAWIHPTELRQAGIVCLGRYNLVHGWYLDMPNNKGVLRIETINPGNQFNGTVSSRPGVIRANTWQHVAAVVRRGENQTTLYVNGFEVGAGTVQPEALDNPNVALHIGRIQGSHLFKGQMNEVRFYNRALNVREIHALLEPGKQFVQEPPEPPQELTLNFGERDITGTVHQSAFLALRLPDGPLDLTGRYGDDLAPHRVSLTPIPPESQLASEFRKFEQRESARTPQEIGVYVDQSGAHPYKLVEPITVPVKAGPQHFEVFGTLEDHLGVVSDPIVVKDRSPGYWLKFRTLTIVNHNQLEGFTLPARFMWTEPIFLVRPDEQWIKAFGRTPGLIPSANGNNGTHGNEAKGPAVYPEAMKSHGHVVVEKVEFETPYFKSWPPRSVQPFLTNGKLKPTEVPVRLKEFAARAWRRPLSETDAKQIDQIWAAELDAGSSDLEALRSSIVTILSDPRFLYLRQSDNPGFASRLSYFLWNGPPDGTLTALAAKHDHLDDLVIEQQVDRLLADKRARRFVEDFVAQWIDFTRLNQIAVDPNYYPAFKDRGVRIREYMKQECVEFFAHILHQDVSCLSFLESDFVMVNETLAEHYGIAGVFTPRFVPVATPVHRGGGVLAQAAVMLAQSNGQDAHAVNRGVWIRSRLLGDPPSDPPPDVPALPESSNAKASGPLSVKQRLDLHLKTGTTCHDCHKDIDPWGIATEGFDAVGLSRTTIQKSGPVVQKVVIDKQEIDGMLPLKQFLLIHRHAQFAYGFTRHMLSYALGRPLTFRDEPIVRALQSQFIESGYNMRSLIKGIVTSTVYRHGPQSRIQD
ncbi:MAG: DUF1592 domain-containing protein [Fuerstiella sp.]|nr:DUF1592 domain-containing protein [Fuerstiella sp.]